MNRVTTDRDVVLRTVRFADAALDPLRVGLAAEYLRRYGPNDEMTTAGDDDFVPPDGVFVVAEVDGRVVAGGGIRRWRGDVAELKRMWTAPDARRRGLARRVLARLEEEAARRGYRALRLETGTGQPEAIAMYRRAGYRPIAPYGRYRHDPACRCFEKVLTPVS